jgi:kinesin family protein 3/17
VTSESNDSTSHGAALAIREDPERGVYVDGLSEWVVRKPVEVYELMDRASRIRATGATRMNDFSSRSHLVFVVIVEHSETVYVDETGCEMAPDEFAHTMRSAGLKREQALARLENRVKQTFRVGKLNLVDLAGSERVHISGATGQRLEESKKINASLSALGNVIAALVECQGGGTRKHVPYRDSKLTRLLADSLGGNCRTTMLATISPAAEAFSETISTLKFAMRAKRVTNAPRLNEDLDQASLLRKYEREVRRLRAELERRNHNVVDQQCLLELDQRRRRAEEDKREAVHKTRLIQHFFKAIYLVASSSFDA